MEKVVQVWQYTGATGHQGKLISETLVALQRDRKVEFEVLY